MCVSPWHRFVGCVHAPEQREVRGREAAHLDSDGFPGVHGVEGSAKLLWSASVERAAARGLPPDPAGRSPLHAQHGASSFLS